MYLRIESLKLENIRCFGKEEFTFTEGVNVITGPNGSGKSTIITAIGYGLFGANYLTGMNLTIDDLVKRDQPRGKITLSFSTQDGTFTSVQKLRRMGTNTWKLTQKGFRTPLAETISESREVIHSLLGEGVDHYTFKTALCSRQGELTKLLDDTAGERSQQIRKILGLDNFDRVQRVVHLYKRKLEQKIEEIEKSLEIIAETRLDEKELKAQIETREEENQTAIEKKENASDKVAKLSGVVQSLTKTKEQIDLLGEQLESNNDELSSLKTKIDQLQQTLQENQEKIDVDEMTSKNISQLLQSLNETINEYNLKIQELNQQLENFEELEEKNNQLTGHLEEIKSKMEDTNTQLKQITDKANQEQLEEIQGDLTKEVNTFDEQLKAITSQMEQLEKNQSEKIKRKDTLKQQKDEIIAEFKEHFDIDMNQISEEIDNQQQRSDQLEKAKDNLEDHIDKSNSEISRLNGRLDNIQQTIKILNSTEESHNCPVCQRDFDNVNNDELIEYHNEEMNKVQERISEVTNTKKTQVQNHNRMKEMLKNLNEKIQLLKRFKDKAKFVKEYQQQITTLELDLEEIGKQLNEISTKKQELTDTGIEGKKDKLESITKQLNKLKKLKENQGLLNQKQKLLLDQLEEVTGKLANYNPKDLKQELKEKQDEKKEFIKKKEIITDKILPLLEKQAELTHKQNNLLENSRQVAEKLGQLKETFNAEELKDKSKELDTARQNVGYYKSEIGKLKEILDELNKNLKKAEKQTQMVNSYQKEIEQLSSIEPVAEKFKNILQDAPELLISKTTSKISSYLTNMVKRLLPQQGFDKVIFQNDGDVRLFNKESTIDKITLSGGEKTVLALALRLALADYVAPLQFLTLDEPTNHLDSRRVSEFMEIIDREQLFSHSKGQLLLVTHRENFNRNATGRIELAINNGTRQLASEE